jgi:hypothetical protein
MLFSRPVRKGEPSSSVFWYVATRAARVLRGAVGKKTVLRYDVTSADVVRFGVKRPKRVPSSSWLPTMKGTRAYFPATIRVSGDDVSAVPSGRGRYERLTVEYERMPGTEFAAFRSVVYGALRRHARVLGWPAQPAFWTTCVC